MCSLLPNICKILHGLQTNNWPEFKNFGSMQLGSGHYEHAGSRVTPSFAFSLFSPRPPRKSAAVWDTGVGLISQDPFSLDGVSRVPKSPSCVRMCDLSINRKTNRWKVDQTMNCLKALTRMK